MNILKANGKEYILKYNFKALSEIQERGIELTTEHEFKLADIALILWIGFRKFQKEMTLDMTFDLIDELLEEMTLEELMKIVQEALEKSLGKQNPSPNK